jgi:hypothetical protein
LCRLIIIRRIVGCGICSASASAPKYWENIPEEQKENDNDNNADQNPSAYAASFTSIVSAVGRRIIYYSSHAY